MVRTIMDEEKDISVDVSKGPEFSKLANAAEIEEVEAVSGEEISVGDTKMETEACMEIEMTRDDMVQEIQVVDLPMEAEVVEGNDGTETIPLEDSKRETEEANSDLDEPGQELDDPWAGIKSEDEAMTAEDTEMETKTDVAEPVKTSGEKLKKGRNSKSPSSYQAKAKAPARKKVGEDVCFICFDGGDLLLCDRRLTCEFSHPFSRIPQSAGYWEKEAEA